MISLSRLLGFQSAFAALSLAYLLYSAYLLRTVGEALSAAPLLPSILLFVAYGACLFLPRIGSIRAYRTSMVFAVLLFGGGGVVGNVVRYLGSGLESYADFGAWALAVAINTFGTVWNIVAALGLFDLRRNSAFLE
ncbi:MAG: hypothetical protein DRR11_19860 [Gammaproteobacteria bacterium]|nr:MAG: hypothetical protein DRR11_19860 [Gammaproteobacteria bacterium]RLA32994.1 MAG: hypothetical protein DRR15_11000 [Gammaproteobacteria bacterium]